ncbi:hypothetical protein JCM12296A_59020 [Desulfosarcina cetonica]|uniref:PilZ domain-containing protein n=1 Tax=Desulfosarcina cetonica TaxID=90730 RepID=UPI0012EEC9D7|nr:PilZ domain-containing protein [Desulfosarcina cetonica]
MNDYNNRLHPRICTDAAISCRHFTSVTVQPTDGVMRNYSRGGAYIETSCTFTPGTIVVLRVTLSQSKPLWLESFDGLRSLSLAEVKWVQAFSEGTPGRYGMGLRYLE